MAIKISGSTIIDDSRQLINVGLSTFTNHVTLTDNKHLKLGNGGDLELYHNSITGESLIQESGGGNFLIKGTNLHLQSTTGEDYFVGTANGSVELYYDDAKKFETLGAGVTVTGTAFSNQLSVSGVSTFSDAVTITKSINPLNVNVLTTNAAINIQRSGSTKGSLTPASGEFRVQTSGTEDLALQVNSSGGSSGEISLKSASRTLLKATHNGGVAVSGILTATAINVVAGSGYDAGNTGVVTAAQLSVGDNQYITAGVGTDLVIYHDGTNSYIDNSTGFLALRVADGNLFAIQKAASAENIALFNADGAVELYHNNSKLSLIHISEPTRH